MFRSWNVLSAFALAVASLSGCAFYDDDCDPYWDDYCEDGYSGGGYYGGGGSGGYYDDGGTYDWDDDDWDDSDGGTGWPDPSVGDGTTPTGMVAPSDCTFVSSELAGSIGAVCDIESSHVWAESAVVTEQATTVELHAADCAAEWSAMLMVTLEGDLMGPEWAVGTKHLARTPSNDCNCSEETAPVTVLGCSSSYSGSCGDDAFGWDQDIFATIVEIEVVEGSAPSTRKFAFTATFADGSQIAGSFDLDCGCDNRPAGDLAEPAPATPEPEAPEDTDVPPTISEEGHAPPR